MPGKGNATNLIASLILAVISAILKNDVQLGVANLAETMGSSAKYIVDKRGQPCKYARRGTDSTLLTV